MHLPNNSEHITHNDRTRKKDFLFESSLWIVHSVLQCWIDVNEISYDKALSNMTTLSAYMSISKEMNRYGWHNNLKRCDNFQCHMRYQIWCILPFCLLFFFHMNIIAKPVFKSECMSLIHLLEIFYIFFFKAKFNEIKIKKKINREQNYNDELSLAFIICSILIHN